MIYGDGSSQGYYARELAHYGLGDGQLGGLFSFVGKAVKAVAKPALSFVPGGSAVLSLLPGQSGDKNQGRYQTNRDLAARARAGDAAAYDQLVTLSKTWATTEARKDAQSLLASLTRPGAAPPVQVNMLPPILQPASSATGPNAGAVVPFFPIPATPSSAGAAPMPTYTPTPFPGGLTPAPAPATTPSWLVPAAIAGAALLGFMALSSGGRGGSTWSDRR